MAGGAHRRATTAIGWPTHVPWTGWAPPALTGGVARVTVAAVQSAALRLMELGSRHPAMRGPRPGRRDADCGSPLSEATVLGV